MKNFSVCAAVLLGTAALSGCAAPAYVSPVAVTRFVGPSPAMLGQGTISIEAVPGADRDSLAFAMVRDAVAQALEQHGYRVVSQRGAQVAVIGLDETRSRPDRRSPVSVGGNGSIGSRGSGVGVGLGIDLTPPPAERINRQLSVAIRSAGTVGNLWEGRASFVATVNSDYADPASAAVRAADALFQDFPGNSGETIEVE